MEFHVPTLGDRDWMTACLSEQKELACEYSFQSIYLWAEAYGERVARWKDTLLVRIGSNYLFPVGRDPLGAVDLLSRENVALNLVCVTAAQKACLEERWPGRFAFREIRDGFDYLWDVNRLADLGGKRLHAKRNHIHNFDDRFPDWMAEPITDGNVAECMAFEKAWLEKRGSTDALTAEESRAIGEALEHREELGLSGLLIRAKGQVVAFSLGGLITEACYDVMFEKADGDIRGAYSVINREMARMVRDRYPRVKWLNREDDLGLEGLRKAKLSYDPDFLLEKYCACEVRDHD